MALFYLGNSPNELEMANDYYLSPVAAPMELLEKFPPTYFLTGEKDPFVDDT
jgi:acetyl esterase/lipase